MPLRTAYKLCPQAIFVDGHPERYREYSRKVHDVLAAFSPLVEMASIDEAYLDITGTERLYGPPLRAAHLLHERMQGRHQLELLDRHRGLAPGGQDLLRPGQAQRRAVGAARPRGRVSGAARRAQDSRRGQGEREEPARTGHPQGGRPGAARRRRSWNSVSASGAWRWPARRRAWTPAAGSIPRSARTRDPSRSATSTLFPRTRRTWRRSKPPWRGSREMVGRRLREHGLRARTIQLKLRYTDFSTITRAHSVARATDARYRAVRGDPRAVPRATGSRRRTVRLLGVHVSGWAGDAGADGPAGRRAATSAGSGRWPRPTTCATGSANRPSRWPPACGGRSASAPTKTRPGCRGKKVAARPAP